MASTTVEKSQSNRRNYRSPASALIWRFRDSRDNWKRKYQEVKEDLHRTRRRLARLENTEPEAPTRRPEVSPSKVSPSKVSPAGPLMPSGPVAREPLSSPLGRNDPHLLAQILDEIRQFHGLLDELRQIREEAERHHRLVIETQQEANALLRALPPEVLAAVSADPLPTAQPSQAAPPLVHEAPPEPKKGARNF